MAVEALPPLPESKPKGDTGRLRATGTDGTEGGETAPKGPESGPEKVPTMVPRNLKSAQIGAVRLASGTYQTASNCTEEDEEGDSESEPRNAKSPEKIGASDIASQQSASLCIRLH